ncbi:MAG: CHAT domain-containing protein [Saprospiraceae bacterium]|nr:CHAT domain-containing protein [Saprospiraceae bacterium]MBP7699278.1 CHAT domain-containing protein [Saprospiraceae bacterium]
MRLLLGIILQLALTVALSAQTIQSLRAEADSLFAKAKNTPAAIEKAFAAQQLFITKTDTTYANFLIELASYQRSSSPAAAIINLLEAQQIYDKAAEIDGSYYGKMYVYLGDLHKGVASLQYYQSALQTFDKYNLQTSPIYVHVKNQIGLRYMFLGQFSNAESTHLENIQLRQKYNPTDYVGLCKSYNNLGLVYRSSGNYPKAEEALLKVIEIYNANNDTLNSLYGPGLNNLSTAYEMMGNLKKAFYYNQKSLDWYIALDKISGRGYVQALWVKALLLKLSDDYSASELYFKKAEASITAQKNIDKADFYALMAAIADLYVLQNRFDDATTYLQKSQSGILELHSANHLSYANNLKMLAIIKSKQHNFTEAEKLFLEAKSILEKQDLKNNNELEETIFDLASLYQENGKSNDAKQLYKNLFDRLKNEIQRDFVALSDHERQYYMANKYYYYDEFYSQLNENDSELAAMALNNRLLTKGILLSTSQQLISTILANNNITVVKNYARWKSNKEFLSAAYGLSTEELIANQINLQELEEEVNQLEKNLTQNSDAFAQLVADQSVSWQAIQQKLLPDEVALEFIRLIKNNSVQYAVIALRASGNPEMIFLKNGEDLETLSYEFYQLNNSDKAYQVEPSSDDYIAFWEATDKIIANAKKVYVSLDGVYNKININTLYDGSQYILDKYEVILLTNLNDILKPKSIETQTIQTAVLIGNPRFSLDENKVSEVSDNEIVNTLRVLKRGGGMKLYSLPNTEIEVQKIDSLLQAKSCKITLLTKDAASEDNIKNIISPNILHIATHGYFLENETKKSIGISREAIVNNPLLRSMLFFSSAQNTIDKGVKVVGKEDGIFTAFEVLNLNLQHTDLVVLSACQTGLGTVMNGEGVYGLQRAFLVAGAKNLIMSLWNVDDRATQELMTTFYELWLSGLDKKLAFRKAQQHIKSKYNNPYYWGAFIMI